MKEAVQKYLDLSSGDIVVDATLGLGGHAKDILNAIGKDGKLFAFEQDERNLVQAKESLKEFKENVVFFHDNFRYLKSRVTGTGVEEVDVIFFDLGLSSPHVDDPERGFSFMQEGPLDMRFDPRNELRAYDVVNAYSKDDLTRVFLEYGEDPMSNKIAHKICEARKVRPFETTTELANFIEKAFDRKRSKKGAKSHPATRIFQAIRMEVNSEEKVLNEALEQAYELVKIGGRIVVLSYHSVEDRIVKRFFKSLEQPEASKEEAIYMTHAAPLVEKLSKKPVVPTEEEIQINPRARSAKLRAYKKIK
jgi:16S rRNA (cytosine1402-N4)-methyltransferase